MSTLVIGDSHTNLFAKDTNITLEFPPNFETNGCFKVFRCGAPLAYNLGKLNTYYNARKKLEFILKTIAQKGDSIILSFGEIDCRYHIINQAKKQNLTFDEIKKLVEICVDRYLWAVDEIFKDYFYWVNKIGIWGPIASTWLDEKYSNRDCPICSGTVDRNIVTQWFNQKLKEKIHLLNKKFYKTNIFYLSIFDELIDKNMSTKMEYYRDNIHLGRKAVPLMINELIKKGFFENGVNKDKELDYEI